MSFPHIITSEKYVNEDSRVGACHHVNDTNSDDYLIAELRHMGDFCNTCHRIDLPESTSESMPRRMYLPSLRTHARAAQSPHLAENRMLNEQARKQNDNHPR